MEYEVIYELTLRCTAHQCQEDLAVYKIVCMDEEAIYTSEKKYIRSKMMDVEPIKMDREAEDFILKIPFFIKEAAIIWVREAFIMIRKKGTRAMYEAAREEWLNIMDPRYDECWFTGGRKVEEWREEMKSIAGKL